MITNEAKVYRDSEGDERDMTDSIIENITADTEDGRAVCITLTREEAIGLAAQILRAVQGEESESEFIYCGPDFGEVGDDVEAVTIIAPGYEIPPDEGDDGDDGACEDCDKMKREHAN